MSSQLLSGVYAPVLTPFKEDLSIDKAAHLQFCKWLRANDVGLAIFGTNSEANSLSVAERFELLDNLASAGIPGSSLMPGTGACAIPDSVALTRAALDAGAAAVLMLPPFYYKNVSDDGLFASYAEVIERIGDPRLKICLYHIPKLTGVPINLVVINRLLSRYPDTIDGLKDSSGEMSNTLSVMKEFPQLRVFCGSESFVVETMQNGGGGWISACANFNPAAIAARLRNWQQPQAEALQKGVDMVRGIIESHPMIAALKAATAVHGKYASFSTVRPPLQGLNAEATKALLSALQGVGFAMNGLAGLLKEAGR
jgi:4-hydroxy-tetrahydrodipicolinate synthase